MQLPFIFFGQHTKYSYAALEYLTSRGVNPQLIVVALPKGKSKRLDPLYYYQYAHGERVEPSVIRGAYDLRLLASQSCCDLLETEEVNNPAVLAHIAGHRPQFFLTVGFTHLFSRQLLAIPPVGSFNIHPTLLPHLRGPAPFFWIWKKGLWDQAGVTLHYMSERADRGNIVDQKPLAITKDMDIFDYLEQAGLAGAELFYSMLQQGEIPTGTSQENLKGSWAPRPQFADLAINPQDVTMDHLETMLKGLSAGYQLHVDLGVDRYFFVEFVEKRPDLTLPSQYLLKGDLLYLPVKDGLVTCRVTE